MEYVAQIIAPMLDGTVVTLQLFFVTLILSLPLGLLLAVARISRYPTLRNAVGTYIWLMRGTPLMLQLLFILTRKTPTSTSGSGLILLLQVG